MKKYLFALCVIPLAVITIVCVFQRVALATVPHNSSYDFFYGYSTWPKASGSKVEPFLTTITKYNTVPSRYEFTDINGDNLPDFLYHEPMAGNSGRYGWFAVFYNNGNNNFNLAYRCYVDGAPNSYGDCASVPRDPNAPANQNKLAQVLQLTSYYDGSISNPTPPDTHIWLDVNGDGLQDYIGDCLNINQGNRTFSQICS